MSFRFAGRHFFMLVIRLQQNFQERNMYKELYLQIILFTQEDVVRTSGESDWVDENVDDNGWT